MGKSKISTKVDFEKDGKQVSYLRVPNSTDHSGWGSLLMPITVVKNGSGPTILFVGGNHGDEYEGPLALLKLAARLQPEGLQGRVIILPSLNYPALLAGTRLSPIDKLNMNRTFPGDRNGTITQIIAHYVYTQLVPLADVVVDFHSGGSSMIFAPCAVIHHLDNPQLMTESLAALKAFGAPFALVLRELDATGMLDTAVEDMGKLFISTELGGGGFVTPTTIAVAERGIDNLLRHFGLQEGAPEPFAGPSRLMETPEDNAYLMALADGLYEPCVEVGEVIQPGQVLGRIHFPQSPENEHLTVNGNLDGVLITRAGRGWAKHGDTIAVIATDYNP